MYGSPSRANRHGGISLASIAPLLPNSPGAPGPLLQQEPCPYDKFYNLVVPASFANDAAPVDMFGNAFQSFEVAYNVSECNRSPFNFSQPQVYGIYVGVMVLCALLNSFSVKALNKLVVVSIIVHVVGSLVIIVGLPSLVPHYQPRHMIWNYWQPFNIVNRGTTGFPQHLCTAEQIKAPSVASTDTSGAMAGDWAYGCPLYGTQAVPSGRTIFQTNHNGVFVANSAINWGFNGINKYSLGLGSKEHKVPEHDGAVNAYIFFCGLLMSQWCYTGYDASAHMSEETKNAAWSGPMGIISCIVLTFAFGLSYIVSILASIVDYNNTTGGPFALSYNPAAQIFWDAFETVKGNGRLSLGFWIIPLLAQFFCTLSSVTSNSRMLYAFSRDDAVPASRFWHQISPSTKIPVNAVWGMTVAALLIALPCTRSVEAFGAVTSIATIGLYISYIIPIALLLFTTNFKPGPFSLGIASKPLAAVATAWVITICIFCASTKRARASADNPFD